MNYKNIIHSPKRKMPLLNILCFTQVISIDQIPKIKLKASRNSQHEFYNNKITKTHISESRSSSLKGNWFDVKKLTPRKNTLEDNKFYNKDKNKFNFQDNQQLKIFRQLPPEEIIPSQLSTEAHQTTCQRIIIKKRTDSKRLSRSDTQYSFNQSNTKKKLNRDTIYSKIVIKKPQKKESSNELQGWYVEPYDEIL